MAHYAELDDNNVVLRVIVVDEDHEPRGVRFCKKLFGGNWLMTSYTGRIRGCFAGVGYTYDPDADAFVPPVEEEIGPRISIGVTRV